MTDSNQSLINQVRAKDLSTLSGLQQVITPEADDNVYISTDVREMNAYYNAMSRMQMDEGTEDFTINEDLENLRSAL